MFLFDEFERNHVYKLLFTFVLKNKKIKFMVFLQSNIACETVLKYMSKSTISACCPVAQWVELEVSGRSQM